MDFNTARDDGGDHGGNWKAPVRSPSPNTTMKFLQARLPFLSPMQMQHFL